jgi:uncharacterized protein (DUF2235 family)
VATTEPEISARPPPGKRLALFFDGTWNEPDDHTNVRRLHLMLADRGVDGIPQRAFYDPGVGTRWYDRLSGGMFGAGLSDNVRSGYRWLTENYDRGDEIYIFGFSRGAFTARSLAGVLARCGLLAPNSPLSFAQLYERYKRGDAARPLYELIRHKDERQGMDFEEQALLDTSYYWRNLVTMVGVWDTVGSLGVPFGAISGVSRSTLRFHYTRLSHAIEHCYQAMALDEERRPYGVELWTEFFPDGGGELTETEGRPDGRYVEQRWFTGAHADVGGGYRCDLLPDRPLVWLQDKAVLCGLGFRSSVRTPINDSGSLPTDSYAQFLCGAWRVITLWHRYVRDVMSEPLRRTAHADGTPKEGWVQTANERIDASVFERCRANASYRPRSLRAWTRRKNLDLEALISNPASCAEYGSAVTAPGIERLPVPDVTKTS